MSRSDKKRLRWGDMFKWTSKYAIPGGVIGSSVWGEIITAGETLHRDASERDFLGWFIVDIFKIFGRKAQRRWSIKNQWCICIISTTSTLFQPNNANITAAGGSSSVCQSALAFKKWYVKWWETHVHHRYHIYFSIICLIPCSDYMYMCWLSCWEGEEAVNSRVTTKCPILGVVYDVPCVLQWLTLVVTENLQSAHIPSFFKCVRVTLFFPAE